jgi:hypothetical protein
LKKNLFILLLLLPFRGLCQDYPITLHQGYIVTDAVIDGQDVHIILDSGAPGLVLNQSYYKTDQESNIPCIGINGDFECQSYLVRKWTWLGVTNKNTIALVSDLSFLEKSLKIKIHALIGLSALTRYYVSIDFDNRTIGLQKEMDTIPEGTFFKFQYVNHLPVIICKVNGEKKILGLDLGSESNFLFGYTLTSDQDLLASSSPVLVTGTDNITDVKHLITMNLEVIGRETVYRSEFIVDLGDKGYFHHDDFDGFLGQSFLSQFNIIIHPGKQKIMLIPREASGQMVSAIMP